MDDRARMEEKMRRFDQVMREKFGVVWDAPPRWTDAETEPGSGPGGGLKTGSPESRAGAAGGDGSGTAAKPKSPEAAPKPERTKPNRKENEFMLNMMILRNALYAHGPEIRERARRAGRTTWRDIRLMTRLIDKVVDALLGTMPPERNEYYGAYAQYGHYELVINGPIRNKRLVLIHDRHLAAVCEAAMTNACVMCMRDGKEIDGCLLRKGLLEVAPPKEVQDGRWIRCEYRRAAGQLIKDEEIEI